MENERVRFPINFKVSDITNKSWLQISETIRAVTYLFHAADVYNQDTFIPLQIDSVPFIIPDPTDGEKISKARVLDWLFRNAFSDFIKAINESLIAAYQFTELQKLQANSEKSSMLYAEMMKKIEDLRAKPRSHNLPTLIDRIETNLSSSLPLKNEILSINNARNCLIHGNGVVSSRYINSSDDTLKLCYLDLDTYVLTDKWQLLTAEMKQAPFITHGVKMELGKKELSFNIDEKLKINEHIFNAVAHTCAIFTNGVYEALGINPADLIVEE